MINYIFVVGLASIIAGLCICSLVYIISKAENWDD